MLQRPEDNGYEQAIDIFLKEHLFADIMDETILHFHSGNLQLSASFAV
jgi:hypothetical protein